MRFARRVLGAYLFLGLASLGRGCWLDHARDRGYGLLAHGDSEQRVVDLMGHPDEEKGPPENVSWDGDDSISTNAGECVRECWYEMPLTFCGEAWTVGFDAKCRVVAKYHYVSP